MNRVLETVRHCQHINIPTVPSAMRITEEQREMVENAFEILVAKICFSNFMKKMLIFIETEQTPSRINLKRFALICITVKLKNKDKDNLGSGKRKK